MRLPQPLPAERLELLEIRFANVKLTCWQASSSSLVGNVKRTGWQTSSVLWCRWGEGLHQAVEAKEGLPVQDETVTLASISYQVSLCLTHQLMPAHIAA